MNNCNNNIDNKNLDNTVTNNNQYSLNKDNSVIFKCINNSWTKKIEPNDIFRLYGFIKSSFYFKYEDNIENGININKFIKSMNQSFKDYDMLLSVLNLYNGESNSCPYLSYTENDYQQVLEIEERLNYSINDIKDINETLPNKICNIIKRDTDGNASSIKIGIFKLTSFRDGFNIGFIISHSIFDQVGVSNYFKYLSQLYNLDSTCIEKVALKKPYFINYDQFKIENSNIKIKNDNDAHQYANSIGFTYTPLNQQLFQLNTEIDLEFNLNEIDSLKNNFSINSTNKNHQQQLIISKNDVITAVLFKLFTYSSLLKDQDIYYLKYACNIRKYLGLGEESLGNIYVHYCIPLKVSDARELPIIELAKISRASVNQISSEQFKKDLIWYNYLYNNNNTLNNKIDTKQYFIPTIYTTILSNWNQFNYDQIKFSNVTPFTLKTISKASVGTNFISFNRNNNNQKVFTTSISISPESINSIEQLSNSTNLFKIINKT